MSNAVTRYFFRVAISIDQLGNTHQLHHDEPDPLQGQH